jgi:hypothetical protein
MIAIMHIKLADNAPGRMLHLFDMESMATEPGAIRAPK